MKYRHCRHCLHHLHRGRFLELKGIPYLRGSHTFLLKPMSMMQVFVLKPSIRQEKDSALRAPPNSSTASHALQTARQGQLLASMSWSKSIGSVELHDWISGALPDRMAVATYPRYCLIKSLDIDSNLSNLMQVAQCLLQSLNIHHCDKKRGNSLLPFLPSSDCSNLLHRPSIL